MSMQFFFGGKRKREINATLLKIKEALAAGEDVLDMLTSVRIKELLWYKKRRARILSK